ncbi:MAG: hypothetical protein JW712_02360, partial [Dehalococcoidales bacterium]|nr:hypothetical protein [Dehalococcoidales bacterium]
MKKWRETKTLLLGLAVLLITFSLFVVLPAVVPSLKSVHLDTLIWACSYRGEAEKYHTWTWPTSEQPDTTEWVFNLMEAKYYEYLVGKEIEEGTYTGELEMGILEHMHRVAVEQGMGKLHFELDPENENRIIVSGYLHYGTIPEHNTAVYNPDNSANTTEDRYSRFLDDYPEIASLLLDKHPVPVKRGTLSDTPVTVYLMNFNRSMKTIETKTDENGFFSALLEPDMNAEYYQVMVENKEETLAAKNLQNVSIPVRIYLENWTWYSTGIKRVPVNQPFQEYRAWKISGLIAAVAAVFFLVYWYARMTKKHARSDETVETKIEEVPTPEQTEQETGTEVEEKQELIKITFPDIQDNLPTVWGEGESLRVIFIPEAVEAYSELSIDWGDDQKETVVPNTHEKIDVIHIFTLPAEYAIKAAYKDKVTGDEISAWRTIRIVDYREEMVRLFGEMLESLNVGDLNIGSDMTPREVERLLIEKLEGVSKENIRQVIDGFEEANYST